MQVQVTQKDIDEWRKTASKLRAKAELEELQQPRRILRNMATNYDMLAARAESLLECAEQLGILFPELFERVRGI